MQIQAHGGSCCGRRHLSGMNGATTASIIALMDQYGLREGGDECNKIVEVVISRENLNFENLKREVVGAGFVLVAEWDNDSGTTCWMYLYAPEWTAFPNGVPVEPVAPPEPRIVERRVEVPIERPRRQTHQQFRNLFADGRPGGWYDQLNQADEATPRCRRYERRTYFSDGQFVTDQWDR